MNEQIPAAFNQELLFPQSCEIIHLLRRLPVTLTVRMYAAGKMLKQAVHSGRIVRDIMNNTGIRPPEKNSRGSYEKIYKCRQKLDL